MTSFRLGFWLRRAALAALLASVVAPAAEAASRIKDIANFEGIRENLLVGYGLVVGLNGTGDSLTNAPFTLQSLRGMLERLGVNTKDQNLRTLNVAAVMVSANLPAFARQGGRVDVVVSALGDAKSLLGGTLLVTPLMGADGDVYAVAQGNVLVGGFQAQGAAASVTKGVPTSGRIPNGAVVEREVPFELQQLSRLRLQLRNPDLTTARRVSQAINAFMGARQARSIDPTTVQVDVPPNANVDLISLMTDIEQLKVEPDLPARVVIDEHTGVIVMGKEVRIDTVAIAQGSLTIRVTETPQVSQPAPFSTTGTTTTVPRTDIQVDEGAGNKLAVVKPGVTLQDLVDGLNALGIGPRDMISILQAIKASGALQAELQVM
jgi:flagellar P-ring protein precursor FlgI